MSSFFIDRPIFAWVIAITIMVAGTLSILQLPIAQYPEIAPPAVQINAVYPGASAEAVENSVVQILEQSLTGIDNVEYFSATSSSNGSANISVTFEAGTDPDIAQVQVQNKLQNAIARLPQVVQQQGISVTKTATGFLTFVSLVDTTGRLSRTDLNDLMTTSIRDPISRIEGVGQVFSFGGGYAMRIWLDANKMASFGFTATDIVSAIRTQNAQIAAGELGGTPAVPGQRLNASLIVQTRLETAEQFGDIIVRVNDDGSTIRLSDVAKVELGAENYLQESELNRRSAAGMGVNLASGANALETAEAVKTKMKDLESLLPEGVIVEYPFDVTPFVEASIDEVVFTLLEAVVLVFLVMLLFLQNVRATLVIAIAIPVVLLGTFGIMAALGFSINTLTMFALVLAIGLLVDDAIVVVENVERIMEEENLPPKEATRKSMQQITGALIGIVLVLSAVFVPMAFFGGSTGVIYRQFSIVMVSAMVLSVTVALILTPALCAALLKQGDEHGQRTTGPLGWFNRGFIRTASIYQNTVGYLISRAGRFIAVYGIILGIFAWLFTQLPSSFLPEEDQGIVFAQVMMPPGATTERTQAVLDQVTDYFLDTEAENVQSVYAILGFAFNGGGQNSATAFIRLKDWEERTRPDQGAQAIANRSFLAFSNIKDGLAFAFVLPAIQGLGNASGFSFQLQDAGGNGHQALIQARNQLLGMASQDERLTNVRPNGQEDNPVFKVDIDKREAAALGISLAEINSNFSAVWAPSYIDDFIHNGRIKRVMVQGEAKNRMSPEDIGDWYVRNRQGDMVPISAFATGHWEYQSPRLERYNGIPSVNIQGQAAAGFSSGEAMDAMEELAGQLPPGYSFEWTDASLQERKSGAQAPLLYALSALVVFLCLAALYESWSVPAAVILVIPLGILGAVCFALIRGLPSDIYFQVGLLTTMGLAAKNAILIVEFAKSMYESGYGLVESIKEAIRIRFRPIIMTSTVFMLAVTPLMIGSGAGAGGRRAIGTAVFGGMFSSTLLAIFFVPLFFYLIFHRKREETHGAVIEQ